MRPSGNGQLQGLCESKINITSVKYLGKSSGDDQIEVKWTAEAASACIKFGAAEAKMPPAQQDSITRRRRPAIPSTFGLSGGKATRRRPKNHQPDY